MFVALALSILSAAPVQDVSVPEEPRSHFAYPLFLGEEPPENRALRHIVVLHPGAEAPGRPKVESLEEALALAGELAERVRAGEDFAELSARYSGAPTALKGGVLGSFSADVLSEEMNAFLFGAELWEVSEPLALASGVHVLQRIDHLAGCRQILVAGKTDGARDRVRELLARLKEGADFAELAKEHSDDDYTASRGGALGIFERSAFDTLVKKAVFELEVGQVSEPVESPRGYHIVKRVPPESLPKEMMDPVWARGRGILISYGAAPGMERWIERTAPEALALAEELLERIEGGENMARLAARFDDDPTGRERKGDLGWLHRRSPGIDKMFTPIFLAEPGEVLPLRAVPQGWVILRREQ